MRSVGVKLTAAALWLAGTLAATPAAAQACGGDFDRSTGHYVDNVVAFASLVDG